MYCVHVPPTSPKPFPKPQPSLSTCTLLFMQFFPLIIILHVPTCVYIVWYSGRLGSVVYIEGYSYQMLVTICFWRRCALLLHVCINRIPIPHSPHKKNHTVQQQDHAHPCSWKNSTGIPYMYMLAKGNLHVLNYCPWNFLQAKWYMNVQSCIQQTCFYLNAVDCLWQRDCHSNFGKLPVKYCSRSIFPIPKILCDKHMRKKFSRFISDGE